MKNNQIKEITQQLRINQVSEMMPVYRPTKILYNKICDSKACHDIFKEHWESDLNMFESMYCLLLKTNNTVNGVVKISQGGLTGTVIDNQLIVGYALISMSKAIIIAHNHPSGNTNPSDTDRNITKKLKDACNLFDIKLHDHLIMTSGGFYYSFADEGLI